MTFRLLVLAVLLGLWCDHPRQGLSCADLEEGTEMSMAEFEALWDRCMVEEG